MGEQLPQVAREAFEVGFDAADPPAEDGPYGSRIGATAAAGIAADAHAPNVNRMSDTTT